MEKRNKKIEPSATLDHSRERCPSYITLPWELLSQLGEMRKSEESGSEENKLLSLLKSLKPSA